MRWFYSVNGQSHYGPVPTLRLLEMLQVGQLTPVSMVWKKGMAQWAPIESVPELQGEIASQDSTPEPLDPDAPIDADDYPNLSLAQIPPADRPPLLPIGVLEEDLAWISIFRITLMFILGSALFINGFYLLAHYDRLYHWAFVRTNFIGKGMFCIWLVSTLFTIAVPPWILVRFTVSLFGLIGQPSRETLLHCVHRSKRTFNWFLIIFLWAIIAWWAYITVPRFGAMIE